MNEPAANDFSIEADKRRIQLARHRAISEFAHGYDHTVYGPAILALQERCGKEGHLAGKAPRQVPSIHDRHPVCQRCGKELDVPPAGGNRDA